MTLAQRRLIEKTFAVIGYLATALLIVMIAGTALFEGTSSTNSQRVFDFEAFLDFLFEWREGGQVFYPTLATSIAAFWVRAFLRAGTEEGSVKDRPQA